MLVHEEKYYNRTFLKNHIKSGGWFSAPHKWAEFDSINAWSVHHLLHVQLNLIDVLARCTAICLFVGRVVKAHHKPFPIPCKLPFQLCWCLNGSLHAKMNFS